MVERSIKLSALEQRAVTAHALAKSSNTAKAMERIKDIPLFENDMYNSLNAALHFAAKKAGLTTKELIEHTTVVVGHNPELLEKEKSQDR